MNNQQQQIFKSFQRAFHAGGCGREIANKRLFQLTRNKLINFVENPKLMDGLEALMPTQIEKKKAKKEQTYPTISHVSGVDGMKQIQNNQ